MDDAGAIIFIIRVKYDLRAKKGSIFRISEIFQSYFRDVTFIQLSYIDGKSILNFK